MVRRRYLKQAGSFTGGQFSQLEMSVRSLNRADAIERRFLGGYYVAAVLDVGHDGHIVGNYAIGAAGLDAELGGGGFVVSVIPTAFDASARTYVDQAVELHAGRILQRGYQALARRKDCYDLVQLLIHLVQGLRVQKQHGEEGSGEKAGGAGESAAMQAAGDHAAKQNGDEKRDSGLDERQRKAVLRESNLAGSRA